MLLALSWRSIAGPVRCCAVKERRVQTRCLGDARLVHDGADILQARAVTSCLMWDVFACGWNGANVRVKAYEQDLEWALTLVLYLVLTPGDGPGSW